MYFPFASQRCLLLLPLGIPLLVTNFLLFSFLDRVMYPAIEHAISLNLSELLALVAVESPGCPHSCLALVSLKAMNHSIGQSRVLKGSCIKSLFIYKALLLVRLYRVPTRRLSCALSVSSRPLPPLPSSRRNGIVPRRSFPRSHQSPAGRNQRNLAIA